MDIGQLRGLLLDLECMTALRHTLKNRAVAALVALCRECARDDASEAALTAAYCRAYDAWLDAAAHGRGGFAREALEAVLFEESPAALLCARMDVLPYSLTNAMANDLDALGRLTAIEPAMFLLLCERAGMSGQTAARLPVWEPTLGSAFSDPRLSKAMLSREGVSLVSAFFKKQGTGLFARCPGSTWVGEAKNIRSACAASASRTRFDWKTWCSMKGARRAGGKHASAAGRAAGVQHSALRRQGHGQIRDG
ncbi:MAG: hypothetical protein ACLR4A_18815 [Christensenellales bacterium]